MGGRSFCTVVEGTQLCYISPEEPSRGGGVVFGSVLFVAVSRGGVVSNEPGSYRHELEHFLVNTAGGGLGRTAITSWRLAVLIRRIALVWKGGGRRWGRRT